jgi:hypothetical protein
MKEQPNVYIRGIKDREIVRSISYTQPLSQRALERLERGLLMKIDTAQHFVDTTEVDLAIARRRR